MLVVSSFSGNVMLSLLSADRLSNKSRWKSRAGKKVRSQNRKLTASDMFGHDSIVGRLGASYLALISEFGSGSEWWQGLTLLGGDLVFQDTELSRNVRKLLLLCSGHIERRFFDVWSRGLQSWMRFIEDFLRRTQRR